jgi:uncharacterized phage protein gp47/JayE
MTYFSPFIDSSGMNVPAYQDILDELVFQAKTIYGQDIYLGNDSADYQFLSTISLKMFDVLQAAQLAFNNRGPSTAIGSGLDVIVKFNGLKRKIASYSTCQVLLTGVAGTVINNGVAQDINGYKWDLPPTVTIGIGGTTTATATCETVGAITALPNDINTILSPTSGWTLVNNLVPATAGQSIETDSQLRTRQSISTELPSETLIEGTIAILSALDGVSRLKVYENATGTTDSNGLPPHSISCVVEGSTDALVAQAIYDNKSPGCLTWGGQTESPLPFGSTTVNIPAVPGTTALDISFYRPTYVAIDVAISVHPLEGYTAAVGIEAAAAITTYLNSLQIGESLTVSGVYGAALSVMANLSMPTFSIRSVTVGRSGSSPLTGDDIEMAFNEIAEGISTNVILTEV